MFYPNHYIVAIFPNLEGARHAKSQLNHDGGMEGVDVIAASGDEVVEFAENHFIDDGIWGMFMTQLSRMIGTEAAYADQDVAAAKKGAAFVAIHCPTENHKNEAWKFLEPSHPLAARYYSNGGIEHLAGEN